MRFVGGPPRLQGQLAGFGTSPAAAPLVRAGVLQFRRAQLGSFAIGSLQP